MNNKAPPIIIRENWVFVHAVEKFCYGLENRIGRFAAGRFKEGHKAEEESKEQYKADYSCPDKARFEINRIVYAVHYHYAGKSRCQAFRGNGRNTTEIGTRLSMEE